MKNLQLILDAAAFHSIENNHYKYRNRFILVHDSIKGAVIKPIQILESCREVICDNLRSDFRHIENFSVGKLRLLACTKLVSTDGGASFKLNKNRKKHVEGLRLKYKGEMLLSHKIINLMEKEFKWPLTKIYLVECKQLNENFYFYYFEGSKKWIKSPNFLSLFMLLVRVSSSLKKYTGFRTLDGFYKCLHKNGNSTLISYLKTHYDRYLLAMKSYNRLFGNVSMRDLYLPDGKSGQFTEGINTLCDLNTDNWDLRAKFAKIIKEEGMLKPWEEKKLIKRRKK